MSDSWPFFLICRPKKSAILVRKMTEPQWANSIPSEVVCNFFYFFFVIYAGIFVLGVLGLVGIFSSPKLSKFMSVPSAIGPMIGLTLAGVQALFFYLICSRGLLSVQTTSEGFAVKVDRKQ